jgi:hypothetical protein
VYECLQTGFELVIGFIELLENVTTSKSSAIANSQSLQFIAAGTNSSHYAVFASRCTVAASNGGRSPYSGFPNCPHASATSF